jgi:hypothetical protein
MKCQNVPARGLGIDKAEPKFSKRDFAPHANLTRLKNSLMKKNRHNLLMHENIPHSKTIILS